MKTLTYFVVLSLIAASSCRPLVSPDPPFDMPYFNQVDIKFQENEIQYLLDHWYAKTYEEEGPIVFRVINDEAAYTAFFSFKPGTVYQTIDFSKNSLLIGMKADLSNPVNSPVNISRMTQNLTQAENGEYVLQVIVRGRQGGAQGGGEWFGFTSLVPKILDEVKLEMNYEFE